MKHLKTIYIFLIIILLNTILNAQTTEVVAEIDISKANDMLFKGDNLYISTNEAIYRKNIRTNAPLETLVRDTANFNQMTFIGNDLYATASRIKSIIKINTAAKPFRAIKYYSESGWPHYLGIASRGSKLYISRSIYVGESTQDKIIELNTNDAFPRPTAITNTLDSAYRLAIRDNELYFTDYSGGRVLKLNLNARFPTTAIQQVLTGLHTSRDLCFNGNDLFVTSDETNWRTSKIMRYNIQSSSQTATYFPFAGTNAPHNMVVKDGYLYVLDNKKILKTRIDPPSDSGQIIEQQYLLVDATKIYISNDNKIQVSEDNAPLRDFLNKAGNEFAQIVHLNNYLYVAIPNQNKIAKIDTSRRPVRIRDFITGLNSPRGLALKNDFLYFTEANGSIKKVDITRRPLRRLRLVADRLNNPNSLIFKDNDLYISETDKISKINVNNSSSTEVTAVITGLKGAAGMVFHGSNLYVSESFKNRVLKYDTAVPELPLNLNSVFFEGLFNPTGLAIKNGLLYVAESESNRVFSTFILNESTSQTRLNRRIEIYTNNYTEELYVYFSKPDSNYEIINIRTQQLVSSGVLYANRFYNKDFNLIDISSLSSGVYALKIPSDGIVHRFVKN